MKFILFVLIFLSFGAQALEVDEKLTVRILKTSETRKTLMLNRGTEDGLVEGDHAKFIVTAGIIARGICVKVSPTRSVWSIYRLVNADFIVNDSVMAIKITSPVKITKDDSKTLVQEDTPTRVGKGAKELGIPLAEGAEDITPAMEGTEDMKALETDISASLVEKNIEAIGVINISGLTASNQIEGDDESINSSFSSHHIGLGAEYYSKREREWYSKLSIIGSINLMRLNAQAYNGASTTNDVTEFAAGVNWHPWTLPSSVMEFIPFFTLGMSMGSIKSTYSPGSNTPGGTEFSSNGSTTGFHAGFGYKYYIGRGFGVRALLDYYMRSETFQEDVLLNIHTRIVGGPRLMLGLSYRF